MNELHKMLLSGNELGCGKWLDLAGLIVPEAAVNILFEKIESGEIKRLEQIGEGFRQMHQSYSAYEIAWMKDRLEMEFGKKCTEFTANDISSFLDAWIMAVDRLDQMRCADARKEFSLTAMVGFGIDGDADAKRLDFSEVRGDEHTNDFITQLKARLKLKQDTVAELKQKLAAL